MTTAGPADWILATFLCILLVELALRLPFRGVVARLAGTLKRAIRVIRARSISDHWKEVAMLAYAGITFGTSLKLAGLLAALVAAAVVSTLALDQLSQGFAGFMTGWLGALYTLIAACLYYMLHRLVLHDRIRISRPPPASARPRLGPDRKPEL